MLTMETKSQMPISLETSCGQRIRVVYARISITDVAAEPEKMHRKLPTLTKHTLRTTSSRRGYPHPFYLTTAEVSEPCIIKPT